MDRLAHRGVLTRSVSSRPSASAGESQIRQRARSRRSRSRGAPHRRLHRPAHVDARNTQHHLEHADRIHRQAPPPRRVEDVRGMGLSSARLSQDPRRSEAPQFVSQGLAAAHGELEPVAQIGARSSVGFVSGWASRTSGTVARDENRLYDRHPVRVPHPCRSAGDRTTRVLRLTGFAVVSVPPTLVLIGDVSQPQNGSGPAGSIPSVVSGSMRSGPTVQRCAQSSPKSNTYTNCSPGFSRLSLVRRSSNGTPSPQSSSQSSYGVVSLVPS